ncbi:MAG: hypothetical protein ACTSWN_14320 [Promethearchaeota archaeon]
MPNPNNKMDDTGADPSNKGSIHRGSANVFSSSRHSKKKEDDDCKRSAPRLGRRESEPHSEEVNYIHDILESNYPDGRVFWDLHHYFGYRGQILDILFDISFFKDFKLDTDLDSYDASYFNNRKPDMAINILSKSTWRDDIGLHMEICRIVGIPRYIIFLPHLIEGFPFLPPFLRVYYLIDDGNYHIKELTALSIKRSGELVKKNFLDISPVLPLKVGLMEKERLCFPNYTEYRLIFLNTDTGELLKTKLEQVQDSINKR